MENAMRHRKRFLFSMILVVPACFFAAAALAVEPTQSTDWPCWRGPNATGVADGRNLPIHWDTKENIRWSVQLPGWGTSSPVVYGNRVFVTSEVEEGGKKSLLTLCFAASNARWNFSGDAYSPRRWITPNSRANPPAATGRMLGSSCTGVPPGISHPGSDAPGKTAARLRSRACTCGTH